MSAVATEQLYRRRVVGTRALVAAVHFAERHHN